MEAFGRVLAVAVTAILLSLFFAFFQNPAYKEQRREAADVLLQEYANRVLAEKKFNRETLTQINLEFQKYGVYEIRAKLYQKSFENGRYCQKQVLELSAESGKEIMGTEFLLHRGDIFLLEANRFETAVPFFWISQMFSSRRGGIVE